MMHKLLTLPIIVFLFIGSLKAESAPPPCEGVIQVSNSLLIENDTVYACVGMSLEFEDVSSLLNVILSTWDFGEGGGLVDGLLNPSTSYAYSEEGAYTVTLSTNALGCDPAQVTKTVIVLGQPEYQVAVQEIDCFGNCNGELTLEIPSINSALYNVVWDINGLPGINAEGLCSGDYNAILTDGFGCTDLTAGPINIPEPEELVGNILLPDTVELCPFSGLTNVQLGFGGGDGSYQSAWEASTAISQPNVAEMNFTPTQQSLDRMYTVVISDGLGCTTEDSIFFESLPTFLGGTVSVGSNPCINCDVFQYQYVPQPGVWAIAGSTVTDASGNYNFGLIQNFLPFTIMADPNPDSHPMAYPGFYPNGHKWNTATILENVCGTSLNKHVELEAPMTFNGTNTLNGGVWHISPGKVQTEEDPIPLIDVVVEKTPPGQAQGRVATNVDGEFVFDFVPNSDTLYTLYVSLPGVPVTSTYEILADDGDETFDNLNFCVNIDTTEIYICNAETPVVTGEEPEINTEGFVVYPNPNNGRFAIETGKFASTQSQVRIVDTMGRLVFQKQYEETPFIINMVNIADGYYSVQIMNETNAQASPISVIR